MNAVRSISTSAPSEEWFRTLELRRTKALVDQDMATVEELHAVNYELITPAGKVFTREAYLNAIRVSPFYSAWIVGNMSFRIAANMAAIRYKAILRFPSGNEVTCWHTDLYEPRELCWQAVWSQATEIRASSS